MTLAYNLSLAAEKAAKKAREEGIAIGEERGISIGITQGAREAKLETARKFLAMGLLVEQVADGTGLSPEEIEKL